MNNIEKYRALRTKAIGPSGSPIRFDMPIESTERRLILEAFPKNCWQHLTKDNLTIPGYNDVHNDFDEYTNRVDRALNQPGEIDADWIGVNSQEEYQKLLKIGDTVNDVKLSVELGQSIANLSKFDKRRRKKWINNEDGEILADAYATRDPEIFYAKRKVEGKKYRTNLVITVGGNADIGAKTLKMRCAVYAKVIDELQRQGHNVGVHALELTKIRGDHTAGILWEVKKNNEQMSLPILQRDLGHPAIFRTALFDIISMFPRHPGYGLGRTTFGVIRKPSHERTLLSKTLKSIIGDPIVVLNLLSTGRNFDEEDIHAKLPEIATHLNNLTKNPVRTGVHYINHDN
jgi:fructose-specific component phosphotransferase system IIB-like protein